jgi:hypothetical protein
MLLEDPTLGHEHWRKVAKELGNVFRQMLSTESEKGGALTLGSQEHDLDAQFYVSSYPSIEGSSSTRTAQTVRL